MAHLKRQQAQVIEYQQVLLVSLALGISELVRANSLEQPLLAFGLCSLDAT